MELHRSVGGTGYCEICPVVPYCKCMKRTWFFAASLVPIVLLVGCETAPPPGVERGPHGTIAYDVLVEASDPGARIEANGEFVGNTPTHLKIFGDKDGTFHDFGSYY